MLPPPRLADPAGVVATALRRVLAPGERLTVSQWAEKHRNIVVGPSPGPWRHEGAPYLRQIMDAASDPTVRELTLKKSEQTGGTEAIYNIIFHRYATRSVVGLMVYPGIDQARDVNKQRLLPTLRGCPAIAEKLGESRDDATTLRLGFGPGSFLTLAGSNSEASLESFPRDLVIFDELDRCDHEAVDIVSGRTNAFVDYLKIYVSTPSYTGVGIDAQYAISDRREWWTPCPHCRAWHVKRRFKQVVWPHAEGLPYDADPDRVEAIAAWACEHCGALVTPELHRQASQRGLWCPAGWRPADDCQGPPDDPRTLADYDRLLVVDHSWEPGENPDDPKSPCAAHPSRPGPVTTSHIGFHLRGMDSTVVHNPFGKIAREFVEKRGRVGLHWHARRLGEAYAEKGQRVELGKLRRLCVRVEEGGYRMKDAPRGIMPSLVAGCDIQKDRVYVVVRAFAPDNSFTALVDAYTIVREESQKLREPEIARIAGQVYTTPDGRRLVVGAVGFDSGKWAEDVYALVHRLRDAGKLAWATKGSSNITWDKLYAEKAIGEATDIMQFRESLHPLLQINTNAYKTSIMTRVGGATLAIDGGPQQALAAEFRVPEDAPAAYLEQLVGEQRVSTMKAGIPVYRWEPRPGFENHFLDCEVIAHALAGRIGIGSIDLAFAGQQPAPRASGADSAQVSRQGAASTRSRVAERSRARMGSARRAASSPLERRGAGW